MTSYTLLLQVLAQPELPYTHVILDEFHERQPDLEVTMALLRLALKKNTKFKVILVSATMDIDDWQGYLDGFDVALFHQSEAEHRVHNFGLEHICPVIGMAPPRPAQLTFAETTIVDNTVFVAQYLLAYLNSMCAPHHAALIFLPGRAHVEQFTMWIETQMSMRMTAVPWHSGVELSAIQAAIRKPSNNRQKVYVATDIAEVSITIPDLVFVIDLCLVKRPQINVHQEASVMFPPLSTQYVSKSNITQRKGRVGRTQQGFYFSLLPSDMLAQLPDHSPAPIVNSRIDELALHVLQVVQNPVALFGLCCSQPTIQAVQTSMRTLTDAGLIVEVEEDDTAVTSKWNEPILGEAASFLQAGVKIDRFRASFVGKLAQVLPVSVSQSLLVFYGFLTGLESVMVLAGACANVPLPFVVQTPNLPPQQQGGNRRNQNRRNQNMARDAAQSIGRAMELAELSMKEHSNDASSDIIAAMGAVLAFKVEAHTGANDHALNDWCVRNQLSRERVQAILDLEDHIKFELGSFAPFRDVDEPEVQQKQLARLPNVVRAMISTAFGGVHALQDQ
jgi:HrpA-like RNA helicase